MLIWPKLEMVLIGRLGGGSVGVWHLVSDVNDWLIDV